MVGHAACFARMPSGVRSFSIETGKSSLWRKSTLGRCHHEHTTKLAVDVVNQRLIMDGPLQARTGPTAKKHRCKIITSHERFYSGVFFAQAALANTVVSNRTIIVAAL